MKNKLTSLSLLILLATCKTGEDIDNDHVSIRTDGFYMGRNFYTSTPPDTINGAVVQRNVVNLLRFYNLDSGMIIQLPIATNFVMTDSANRMYFDAFERYKTENPRDINFVNFNFRLYAGDSIKFSQKAPGLQYDYIGMIYKDSIALKYALYPTGVNKSLRPSFRALNLKFYPKRN